MIEVLKQALEALECLFGIPEQFTGKGGGDVAVWTLGGSYRAQQAIPALRQAIAELESQEPVAWGVFEGNLHDMFFSQEEAQEMADLKGTPAEVRPLYTHPPQRTWVGLTDDEHCDIWYKESLDWMEYGKAIEAKLKEKNNG
jgi:hypothetical protein